MKPRATDTLSLGDTPDDPDDLELREIFSVAASTKRDDFALDLDDVLARAERRHSLDVDAHADARAHSAPSPLVKLERTFAARNGAFVSTVSAFAAAACLWLSAGAGYATSSSNETEATLDGPGICAESNVDSNACMIPASLVRAPSVRPRALSSDDFRVCDARLVTCVP